MSGIGRDKLKKYVAICVIVSVLLTVIPCGKADAAGMRKSAKAKVVLVSRTASMAQVKWGKITGVSGYQIKFTISGKKTVIKNVARSSTKFVVYISEDESAKVYVRGYQKRGRKKVYTKWSKKLSVARYKNQAVTEEKTHAYNFRKPEYLTEHFLKHGAELGYKTEEEYLAGANRVIVSPVALHKSEAEDGDDIYFIENTGELVVVSTDGYI